MRDVTPAEGLSRRAEGCPMRTLVSLLYGSLLLLVLLLAMLAPAPEHAPTEGDAVGCDDWCACGLCEDID